MSDLISRKALCDYALNQKDKSVTPNDIMRFPSAQPERKKGKWIEDAKTYYEQLNERGLGVDEYTPYFTDDIACSVCLAKYSTIDNETQFFKFCPNCGADMRGEQDDESRSNSNAQTDTRARGMGATDKSSGI